MQNFTNSLPRIRVVNVPYSVPNYTLRTRRVSVYNTGTTTNEAAPPIRPHFPSPTREIDMSDGTRSSQGESHSELLSASYLCGDPFARLPSYHRGRPCEAGGRVATHPLHRLHDAVG